MKRAALILVAVLGFAAVTGRAQEASFILKPARIFDGQEIHESWVVRVKGARIEAVGPASSITAQGAALIDLPGATLTPGLIEGHSHVLLHPYSETKWED